MVHMPSPKAAQHHGCDHLLVTLSNEMAIFIDDEIAG